MTVRHAQDELGVSQPAAHNAIEQLLEAGIISPATTGQRNRVWTADGAITAFEACAARARSKPGGLYSDGTV